MAQVLTTCSPFDTLIEAGVQHDAASALADEFDGARIAQAVEQFHAACEIRELDPEWIVDCLRDDWLPHRLFNVEPPMDHESNERVTNLILGGKRDFVTAVESCVAQLSRLEWEGICSAVVKAEPDETYRRRMFRNPTRSNWVLCEKVYARWKNGYLESSDFRQYLTSRLWLSSG